MVGTEESTAKSPEGFESSCNPKAKQTKKEPSPPESGYSSFPGLTEEIAVGYGYDSKRIRSARHENKLNSVVLFLHNK